MAASYDYGLTYQEVLVELPIDSSEIEAFSEPVSTSTITQWINEGAGRLNAVLDKSGITASASMDADALEALKHGVKAYAAWRSLQALGYTGELLTSMRDTWHQVLAEYSNRPQQLGDAYDDGLTINVDNDTKSESWSFIDSEGSIW